MNEREMLLQELKKSVKKEEETQTEELKDVVPILEQENEEEKDEVFEKFKEDFIKEELVKDFFDFLDLHKEYGAEVFEKDFFIKCKMEHPGCKTMILDPNMDERTKQLPQKFFIIKPLYPNEYTQFIKQFGPREKYPEEFMESAIRTCILFPENISSEEYNQMPSGVALTLYHTVLDISDFNKPYKILEL